jgi:Asp/Glu/hydantoin racemase
MEGANGLLDAFLAAAGELVDLGADGITTNCGFLSIYQAELAQRCRVPVATSSLMQVPLVQATLPPGKRVGILTVNAGTLSSAHLAAAGVPAGTPVMGTEGGREFTRVLIDNEPALDVAAAARDIVDAGKALAANHPEVGAIVLECTNMCPYAALLRDETGLPVYDIYSFVTWFHASLSPREFGPPADRATLLSGN